MLFVHRKFDADRLSKKKVIEKIRWTTFVDFGHYLGLRIERKRKERTLTSTASCYGFLCMLYCLITGKLVLLHYYHPFHIIC